MSVRNGISSGPVRSGSHVFHGFDADQVEGVGEDPAKGGDEGESRLGQAGIVRNEKSLLRILCPGGEKGVESPGQFPEKHGDLVRLEGFGTEADHVRITFHRPKQILFLGELEEGGIARIRPLPGDPQLASLFEQAATAGMGVLDVIHGIVHGVIPGKLPVEGHLAVGASHEEKEANHVHTQFLDDLFQCDKLSAAGGELDGFAVLEE